MTNIAHHTLVYDGLFDGFLSCVFHVFDRKLGAVQITKNGVASTSLFSTSYPVTTNEAHARRVWIGLKKKLSAREAPRLYAAFLSEQPNVEDLLLDYIRIVFESDKSVAGNYADPTILKVAQFAKNVGREVHRMEAFVRFKLTKDGLYFANIAPDFDVIPLISKHFESRYADQRWMIYDLTRKYGIYYDLQKVETVELTLTENAIASKNCDLIFDPSEFEFQQLWKDYFDHTNIKARKNTRLHVQHVPKRYWKYLSEKGGEY
ncbi:MAG: TIGR03915 family putative DNA repair protein [Cyclobacteriaceae bacterium]